MRYVAVTTLLVVLASGASFSQDYKRFRVGLGLGFAVPSETFGGIILHMEPSWRLSGNFDLFGRIETMAPFYFTGASGVSIVGSYTMGGKYYFSQRAHTRWFTGLGLGVYTANRGALASCTCEDELKPNAFGFFPRLGYEHRHFTISAEYNIIQSVQQIQHYDMPHMGMPEYYDARLSYFALKFGFFLGGGQKN
jgi:hypothetical protein